MAGSRNVDAAIQYASRNRLLSDMGYTSYSDYLASPLWYGIRLRVLKRDENKCFGCGRRASQVHHRSYTKANLGGHTLEKMVSICRACHERIEFDGETKLSPVAATLRLDEIRSVRDAQYTRWLAEKQRRKEERQKRRQRKRDQRKQTKTTVKAERPKPIILAPSIVQRAKTEAERAQQMLDEHRKKLRVIRGDNRVFGTPYTFSKREQRNRKKRMK